MYHLVNVHPFQMSHLACLEFEMELRHREAEAVAS